MVKTVVDSDRYCPNTNKFFFCQYSTTAMAENDPFQEKNITQNRKKFITQTKTHDILIK